MNAALRNALTPTAVYGTDTTEEKTMNDTTRPRSINVRRGERQAPEIANDALVFDADELAWFLKHFSDVEWSVYVSAMDEVHTHADPELPDDDPNNSAHTEASARATAEWINTHLKPRDEFDPVMKAVVLHHGVPVETAGA